MTSVSLCVLRGETSGLNRGGYRGTQRKFWKIIPLFLRALCGETYGG